MRTLHRLAAALVAATAAVTLSVPTRAAAEPRLAVGAPVEVTAAGPGTTRVVFTAAAGDRLGVVLNRDTLGIAGTYELVVRTPGGAEAGRSSLDILPAVVYLDAHTTGDHTAEVVTRGDGRGTGSLRLIGPARQETGIGTAPTLMRLPEPGARAFATFRATAGTPFSVTTRVEGPGFEESLRLIVRAPGGRLLGELNRALKADSAASENFVAPTSGIHTLELRTSTGWSTGTATVHVAGLGQHTAVVNGPPARVDLPAPGARAAVSFPATAGQRLSLVLDADGIPGDDPIGILVRGPGGADPRSLSSGTYEFEIIRTGRHVITVDPSGWGHGTMTLAVIEAATGSATVGGPSVPVVLDRTGQRGVIGFDATAGQRLTATALARDLADREAGSRFLIRSPYGAVLHEESISGLLYPFAKVDFTAPATGRYTVEVVTDSPAPARFDVAVAGSSSTDATVGGPAVQARVRVPRERAYVRFPVRAGQPVKVTVSSDELAESLTWLTVSAPDGTEVAHRQLDEKGVTVEMAPFTARAAGTFQLEIKPGTDRTGTATVRITSPG
ncbi:hypothetical protein AB0G04_19190 [Actinoplanes sp. NPDC023801]|uniref:hypothetical protein n=1 Tax=Actinoplanes sp. NPDC023801 TaxID=3154595 RepID=UPI0033CE3D38